MAEDHELWAEKDGKKSAVKTISSWDARKEFEVSEAEVDEAAARAKAAPLHPSSFFVTSSLSSAGLAWPLVAFITWPTKNAGQGRLAGAVLLHLLGVGGDHLVDQPSSADASVICSGFSRS